MSENDFRVPRRSASLRVLVEEQLRRAILVGRFGPGDRLVERELCEMLGVGRTSVREALRQLEAEGLITSYPHRGPVVSSITLDEARQLYEFRALLEGHCGRRCAEYGSESDHAELTQAYRAFAKAAAVEAADALLEFKSDFYDWLTEGSGNIFVRQALEALHNRITILRMTSLSQPGRVKQSVTEIGEIVDAIRARDADAAEVACRRHVERAAEVAVARLIKSADGSDRESDRASLDAEHG